jgi:S1-C subfamily serine protease
MVLLPWERDADCSKLKPGMADAVFGIDSHRPVKSDEQRPRLGVALGAVTGGGVRIDQVSEGSVAAQAGLKAGDVVLTIAGRAPATTTDVVSAVGRQAPGTWLPLRIRRDGNELDIVAKFPPASP